MALGACRWCFGLGQSASGTGLSVASPHSGMKRVRFATLSLGEGLGVRPLACGLSTSIPCALTHGRMIWLLIKVDYSASSRYYCDVPTYSTSNSHNMERKINFKNNFKSLEKDFQQDTGLTPKDNMEMYIQYCNFRVTDQTYQMTWHMMNELINLPDQIAFSMKK